MGAEEDAARATAEGAGRLARKIVRVADRASNFYSPGMRPPVLDAHPDADDPTTMWMFDDGRTFIRGTDGEVHAIWPGFPVLHLDADPAASTGIDYYRHDPSDEWRVRRPDGTWARYASVSAASGGTSGDPGGTSTKAKKADPKTKEFTEPYSPTWARTFCPAHGVETGPDLFYGTFAGSNHPERRIMLGFNASQIESDLSGAKILAVHFKMRNAWSWDNAGVDVHFGGHAQGSPPGGYGSVRERVFRGHWPKSGYGREWRRVPDWFAKKFKDGTIKGITINQPSGANAYYGAMAWQSFEFRVRFSKEV